MKKVQYQDALGKYTECLKIKPDECAIYTNRLETHLSMNTHRLSLSLSVPHFFPILLMVCFLHKARISGNTQKIYKFVWIN